MALMAQPLRAALTSIYGLKYTSSLDIDIKNVNLEAELCQVSCVSLSKYEAKLITQEHNTVTNTPSHLTGDIVQC